MQQRMNNPAVVLDDAMKALHALSKASEGVGLPQSTIGLAQLRASQINGCGVCVDSHARQMLKAGETTERLFSVAAWRDTPYYTDAERAALALAEAVTRMSGPEPVPDDLWAQASEHYDERQLSALLLAIAAINVWNRLNVATHQQAGVWTG
jgi:AhpD family alkylhydroperoxidase